MRPSTSVAINFQRAEDWSDRRKQVETAFRQSIGLGHRLPDRTPLNARVLRTRPRRLFLENVIFYSRPETPVPANIYRPKVPSGQRCLLF